jgi:hypothetical protein
MAIRVYNNHDYEGDVVVETTEHFYLGEAKDFAKEYDCTVMIKSFQGWKFKKGPSRADLGDTKPSALVECRGKDVFII